MPLTSHPSDTAGNIPLIMLACDGDDPTSNYHPYARATFVTGTFRPCIASIDLKGLVAPAKSFAVWLPTPTLVGHKAQRNMFIAWELESGPQNPDPVMPKFQVYAVNQPRRPPNGQTKFSKWDETVKDLSGEKVGQLPALGPQLALTELTTIETPGEGGLSPDATCFLRVTMPQKVGTNPQPLFFRLHGVGLDQW